MSATGQAGGAAPLQVAVLGAGQRAGEYLDTLSRLGAFFRLVGVCDADAERARRVAAERGTAAFARVEAMLAGTEPDILFVCIPPDGHRPAVELAAERGVHVLCETPIAPTLALADAMIAACRRHSVVLEVAENVWRWPRERLKRRIVAAGLIGAVTQVHLWYGSGSYHGIGAVRRLGLAEPVRARGLVHEAPVPVHVDRLGRTVRTGRSELGLVEFAGGALLVYQNPLWPHARSRWEVVGAAGAILGDELVLVDGERRRTYPIRERIDATTDPPRLVEVEVETEPPVVWENPWRDLPIGAGADEVARADVLLGLRDAIVGGTPPPYGPEQARADQEVLVAVRESALHDGAWVALPLAGPTEVERRIHAAYRQRYGHEPLAPHAAALGTLYPNPPPAAAALEPLFAEGGGGHGDARRPLAPFDAEKEGT